MHFEDVDGAAAAGQSGSSVGGQALPGGDSPGGSSSAGVDVLWVHFGEYGSAAVAGVRDDDEWRETDEGAAVDPVRSVCVCLWAGDAEPRLAGSSGYVRLEMASLLSAPHALCVLARPGDLLMLCQQAGCVSARVSPAAAVDITACDNATLGPASGYNIGFGAEAMADDDDVPYDGKGAGGRGEWGCEGARTGAN